MLRELVDEGTTLVLTTQYLEEADHLADEIVVVDKGKVIAAGTPTQLKDQAGAGQRRGHPDQRGGPRPTPPGSAIPLPRRCTSSGAAGG